MTSENWDPEYFTARNSGDISKTYAHVVVISRYKMYSNIIAQTLAKYSIRNPTANFIRDNVTGVSAVFNNYVE